MNFSLRLGFEDRPHFERVVTRIAGIGALVGLLWTPLRGEPKLEWPAVLGTTLAAVLLGARPILGRDDCPPFFYRLLSLAGATVLGLWLSSLPAGVIAIGAAAGLAMAGPAQAPNERRLAGAIGGALSVAWALWIIPGLLRMFSTLPASALTVGASVAGAGALWAGADFPAPTAARRRALGEVGGARDRIGASGCGEPGSAASGH